MAGRPGTCPRASNCSPPRNSLHPHGAPVASIRFASGAAVQQDHRHPALPRQLRGVRSCRIGAGGAERRGLDTSRGAEPVLRRHPDSAMFPPGTPRWSSHERHGPAPVISAGSESSGRGARNIRPDAGPLMARVDSRKHERRARATMPLRARSAAIICAAQRRGGCRGVCVLGRFLPKLGGIARCRPFLIVRNRT